MEGTGYRVSQRVAAHPRPQPTRARQVSTNGWLRVGRQSFINRRAFEEHRAKQAHPRSLVSWRLGWLLAVLAFILNIWQPGPWKR